MYIKNLSYWGVVKLNLIFAYLLSILFSPFFVIYYLIAPQKFTFKMDDTINIYGLTLDISPHLGSLITVLFLIFVAVLVKSAILYVIFTRTPIGKITIGHNSNK